MRCNVVWFRRDHRLSDNEIVTQAAANLAPTLFVFTLDEWFFKQTDIGEHRVRFLIESLTNLHLNLEKLGAKLLLLEGDSEQTLISLLQTLRQNGHSPALYKNRDRMGYKGIRREKAVEEYCANHNLPVHTGLAYFYLMTRDRTTHGSISTTAIRNFPSGKYLKPSILIIRSMIYLSHIHM